MNKQFFHIRNIWLVAFCYASILSLLFQKVVLPSLPSLHAGFGLLKNDAFFYHQSALVLAEQIRQHGWSAWSAWSAQEGTTGNVGVLSALYAIFPPSPALIIPVNAFFHATSAALLLLIGRELWPGRVGNLAGLIAAGLFIIFPSALSWYSQPLKDSYVIAGMLIIFYSWIIALKPFSSWRGLLRPLALMAAGILLVVFVKPYYLKLLIVVLLLTIFVLAFQLAWIKHTRKIQVLSFFLLAGALLLSAIVVTRPYQTVYASGESYAEGGTEAGTAVGSAGAVGSAEKKWEWKNSSWLPGVLERNMELAARTRIGMIRFNQKVGAGSLIDENAAPQSAVELVEYLPRALQIGLFAPFPDTWLQKPSAMRLIAVAETACWYLLFPGLLLALYYRRSVDMTVTLLFAGFFLAVFSFVTPNVGTLYRYRYVFEFLLIVAAAGGWVQLYLNRRGKGGGSPVNTANGTLEAGGVQDNSAKQSRHTSKKKLVSTALTVSMLTLLGYLGFFARDLFMIRSFGAGNEMDIFFLGSMIPMFFISVLSMPVGTSIIPVYSALRNSEEATASTRLIGGTLFFQAILMACLSVLLYFFAPLLFAALGLQYSGEKLSSILEVMNVYLLIMLTGGVIIVANAVLNAEGRLVFPSVAQLIVPCVVILVLMVFGASYGIYAAVYGMLLGQIANLALVVVALHDRKMLAAAFRADWSVVRSNFPLQQYGILAAAALSTALFIPLANAIAATLSSGSVAIIGMGTKVIILITGVIGMGMTTVLLPYFSSLVAKSHHLKAQSDLSFFLLFATVVSIPLALVLRLFAAALTYKLVAGAAVKDDDINELIRTIQFGVAQLPFFTCSLIAVKYITAYQRSGIILLSSLVGLVLTIVLSHVFVGMLGVSGISLAMTIAMAVSAIILVVYVSYLRHLPTTDSVFIFANWLVFAAMFVGLHYHIYIELIIFGIIYILLSIGNWRTLIAEWDSRDAPELAEAKVDSAH